MPDSKSTPNKPTTAKTMEEQKAQEELDQREAELAEKERQLKAKEDELAYAEKEAEERRQAELNESATAAATREAELRAEIDNLKAELGKGNQRAFVPDDVPAEVLEGHTTGASSWWSDPEATDPSGAPPEKG